MREIGRRAERPVTLQERRTAHRHDRAGQQPFAAVAGPVAGAEADRQVGRVASIVAVMRVRGRIGW
jgi:hypothetical protein